MLTVYGFKSCDTVQKALKWLQKQGVSFRYFDYREQFLPESVVDGWLNVLPVEKVINPRSTTFKELTDNEKEQAKTREGALKLALTHTAVIKRPVLDFGNGTIITGWDEKVVRNALSL
jgi:Spx/MgsR family transcriptional regulator